jgi:hypothetical protein
MVVAKFTVVTFVSNLLEFRCRQASYIPVTSIDTVKQCAERRTEVEAATAAVTDIIDPQRLFREIETAPVGVVEINSCHAVPTLRASSV